MCTFFFLLKTDFMNSLEQGDKQIQDYHTCHLKKKTCPTLYRQGQNVNITQHRQIRRMLKQSTCLTLTECSLTWVDRQLKSCRNQQQQQQQYFFSPFEFSCEDISSKGASWFVQRCLKCDCHMIGVLGSLGNVKCLKNISNFLPESFPIQPELYNNSKHFILFF